MRQLLAKCLLHSLLRLSRITDYALDHVIWTGVRIAAKIRNFWRAVLVSLVDGGIVWIRLVLPTRSLDALGVDL